MVWSAVELIVESAGQFGGALGRQSDGAWWMSLQQEGVRAYKTRPLDDRVCTHARQRPCVIPTPRPVSAPGSGPGTVDHVAIARRAIALRTHAFVRACACVSEPAPICIHSTYLRASESTVHSTCTAHTQYTVSIQIPIVVE